MVSTSKATTGKNKDGHLSARSRSAESSCTEHRALRSSTNTKQAKTAFHQGSTVGNRRQRDHWNIERKLSQ